MSRHINRVNYYYVDKLFLELNRLGIDPTMLPRSFVRLAWEDKLEYLRANYNLSACPRCKLPKRDSEMDSTYSLCTGCAQTMHSKRVSNPRVAALLGIDKPNQQGASILERIRKLATEQDRPISSAQDILERASKRLR